MRELAQDQRQVDEEVRLLRRLAKVTADKAERLSALRRAAEVSGDMDLLRMVVLHDPDDVDARLALAQMAERRGDLGAAVGEFKTLASHLHGDAAAAALHRAAGLLWRVKSDAQGAIDLLGEALEVVEHAATFPEPFLLLSEIYETQGDATAAAAVLTPFSMRLSSMRRSLPAIMRRQRWAQRDRLPVPRCARAASSPVLSAVIIICVTSATETARSVRGS